MNKTDVDRDAQLGALKTQFDALMGPKAGDDLLKLAGEQRIAQLREKEHALRRPGVYDAWIRRLENSGLNVHEAIDAVQSALVAAQAAKLKSMASSDVPIISASSPGLPNVLAQIPPASAAVERSEYFAQHGPEIKIAMRGLRGKEPKAYGHTVYRTKTKNP